MSRPVMSGMVLCLVRDDRLEVGHVTHDGYRSCAHAAQNLTPHGRCGSPCRRCCAGHGDLGGGCAALIAQHPKAVREQLRLCDRRWPRPTSFVAIGILQSDGQTACAPSRNASPRRSNQRRSNGAQAMPYGRCPSSSRARPSRSGREGCSPWDADVVEINSPVSEARRLHLPFIVGVLKPSMPRSTITPWMRPSSFFARTTASCARAHWKSTSRPVEDDVVAIFLVRGGHATWVDPWSGSVNPKHPIHSPVASLGRTASALKNRTSNRVPGDELYGSRGTQAAVAALEFRMIKP